MKKRNFPNRLLFLTSIFLSILFFNGCVFKKNSDKESAQIVREKQNLVNTQNDARVLVEIATLNIKSISLLTNEQKNVSNNNIQQLLYDIKMLNNDIDKVLTNVATRKLIMLTDVNFSEENMLIEKDFATINQDLFISKIDEINNKQLQLLKKLTVETKDNDFKIVAIQIQSKLKIISLKINAIKQVSSQKYLDKNNEIVTI